MSDEHVNHHRELESRRKSKFNRSATFHHRLSFRWSGILEFWSEFPSRLRFLSFFFFFSVDPYVSYNDNIPLWISLFLLIDIWLIGGERNLIFASVQHCCYFNKIFSLMNSVRMKICRRNMIDLCCDMNETVYNKNAIKVSFLRFVEC